jgi:hypothetical protein
MTQAPPPMEGSGGAAPPQIVEPACELADVIAELRRRDTELHATLENITAALHSLVQRGVAFPAPNPPASALLTSLADRHDAYRQMIPRLRAAVEQVAPADATVLVISKGDSELLRLGWRKAQHFPQSAEGHYAGFHPADSAAAIEQLDTLREDGAAFLVVPATALWWLEHYRDFAQHLEACGRCVFRDDAIGVIYALRAPAVRDAKGAADPADQHFKTQLSGLVRSLLPPKARLAVVSKGDPDLVAFEGLSGEHFPQAEDGQYAGHYPADSAGAIAHLEALRAAGAEYLLIPKPSAWWLEYYAEFREHLETRCRLIARQKHFCALYALNPRADG